jgi:meiotically up-regulated gene 157 (Mug157) protein
MWLRDSAWQMRPLLVPAKTCEETAELIASVSRRQAEFVLVDPYANAFKADPADVAYDVDFADQHPRVWERKYELDSLAAVLDLAARLWRVTGCDTHLGPDLQAAVRLIVSVIRKELNHDPASYRLHRPGVRAIDSLSNGGYGAPFDYTGMSWSGFRPSDDACAYPFLIPANAAAVASLRAIAEVAEQVWHDPALASDCRTLASTIDEGIHRFGTAQDESGNRMFVYEVDGLGSQLLMDDANVPSLMSLPYLGYCAPNDPAYLSTRRWLLSPANPTFFAGKHAKGIGSPHTPDRHVWPISIAISALTSTDEADCPAALELLERCDGGTGRMHESFHVDDPRAFTRPWFSWADMTYVHLVLRSLGLSGLAD